MTARLADWLRWLAARLDPPHICSGHVVAYATAVDGLGAEHVYRLTQCAACQDGAWTLERTRHPRMVGSLVRTAPLS